jgi:hypothetical protein
MGMPASSARCTISMTSAAVCRGNAQNEKSIPSSR